MTDNLVFEITEDEGSDYIKMQPIFQPYLDSGNNWDKNCIQTLLTIKAGAFSGQYNADIFTFEFEKLKQDLRRIYNDLKGGFTFCCRDHELELDFQGDGYGHFKVDCIAMDEPSFGATLKFQFSNDQTFILGYIKQLNDITKRFPIIGKDTKIVNEY